MKKKDKARINWKTVLQWLQEFSLWVRRFSLHLRYPPNIKCVIFTMGSLFSKPQGMGKLMNATDTNKSRQQ